MASITKFHRSVEKSIFGGSFFVVATNIEMVLFMDASMEYDW